MAVADRGSDRRPHGYAIGLWGDLPYTPDQISRGVPNMIADMNRQRLAFSVHDGDIKSGGSRCDDEVYARFERYLSSLRSPAMYTPGDNDWTDCDRPAAGAYSSRERLDFLRRNLFDTRFSYGKRRIPLKHQAAPYVENRRWQVGGVTYATLHVVGSNNNLGDVGPDPEEFAGRNRATNAWLRETFAEARRRRSRAVMLIAQANPGFDRADPTRAPVRDPRTLEPRDGFHEFLTMLRARTVAFRRPVALVHGDSHYFRVDKPLLDPEGRRLENFTRVETPGEADPHWLKVLVDPDSREVFSYQPQQVPANRVAVPTPRRPRSAGR
ncbi:MAG: hypothetical protein M3433_00570 [Actinomycetota bacterium]|nr:hypothetical protein [Actinomycetota bacterium]